MKGILSIQSHVTFGHAGNSAAVFPMQRMGHEVWPIHTVHFSNHTQYPQKWTGTAVSGQAIGEIFEGLVHLGILGDIDAIVTGYLGDASQCEVIADIVRAVKAENPDCLYVCDPVMGDPVKGCIVSDGVAENLISILMPMADILAPNQFELTTFTGIDVHNLDDAIVAAKKARALGPKLVLAKNLHSLSDDAFSMLLTNAEGAYLVQRPHLDFQREPVGVGDMITATFTAGLLAGKTPVEALEHCNNAVFGVLKATEAAGEWELQTIAAQKEFEVPTSQYKAAKKA